MTARTCLDIAVHLRQFCRVHITTDHEQQHCRTDKWRLTLRTKGRLHCSLLYSFLSYYLSNATPVFVWSAVKYCCNCLFVCLFVCIFLDGPATDISTVWLIAVNVCLVVDLSSGRSFSLFVAISLGVTKYETNKNLAIVTHNTLRASIGIHITPWPWNLG